MNFSKLLVSIFTISMFVSGSVQAQSTGQQRQGADDIFYRTLAILPQDKIPSQYLDEVLNQQPDKCTTMQYIQAMNEFDRFTPEQQALLKSAFSRPNLPFSYVSPNGEFRIHYSLTGFGAVSSEDLNNNEIPDYVEEVADYFDQSHFHETSLLNFRTPPADENVDGSEYDVYIQGLGLGGYGSTTPEIIDSETNSGLSSYIIVDNDFENGQFRTGLQGAQVTAAHEYMHAIQFGYRDAFERNDYFYYELCASWVEDVVYDDVNDYYGTTPWFLQQTHRPLNQYGDLAYNYGSAIWNHFLDEKYPDNNLVLQTWGFMGNGQTVLRAIQSAFSFINTDLEAEFAEFAVWNYFTGSRSDAINFYDEGSEFGEVNFSGDYIFRNDTTIFDSTLTLSYKYYRFTTTEPGSYIITGAVEQNRDWYLAVIARQAGQANQVKIDRFDEGIRLDSLAIGAEIVVIPVHVKSLQGVSSITFNSTFGNYQISLFHRPENEQRAHVQKIFPNPFIIGHHQNQRFLFTPVIPIDFEVNIFDFNGKVVRSSPLLNNEGILITSGFQWDGVNYGSFLWDGRDDTGNFVASGIYVLRLKQGKNTDFVKFAVVNK